MSLDRYLYRHILRSDLPLLVRCQLMICSMLEGFRRRKGLPVSSLGGVIKIMTCLLYIISTVHLALAMHQDYEAYVVNVDANQVFANQGDRYIIAQVSIEIVNVGYLRKLLLSTVNDESIYSVLWQT